MTLEAFQKRKKEDEEWSPGWEAIDGVFEALYPGQEPAHFATLFTSRAKFGFGEEYLDGYSIYTSPNGYQHLVTYGMTELYAEEKALGGEWNKWGYEMTMKLAETDIEQCKWAINMLGNLARYTYKTERYFEPYQYVAGNGSSICLNRPSAMTALLIVNDTEAKGVDTIYGRTDFLQLVGITQPELEWIMENRDNVPILIERMKKDNPHLVTDLNRTKSYL